jgi:large subunit ribosomal protein L25
MNTINAELRGTEEKMSELRSKGILPGVLYGPKGIAVSIKLSKDEFDKIFKDSGESTLINLKVDGKDTSVLIHDIQKDTMTRGIIHVDFYKASLKEKTEVPVTLVFQGESFAVKNLAGTLVKSFHEIEVSALPQNLPHKIIVDISSLKNLGDIITVKDLKIPEGVEIVGLHENDTIASISAAKDVDKELSTPIEEGIEETEEEKEGTEEEKEGTEEATKETKEEKKQN